MTQNVPEMIGCAIGINAQYSDFTTSAGVSNVITLEVTTLSASLGITAIVGTPGSIPGPGVRGFKSGSKTPIWDKDQVIDDGSGNEVYGKITKPAADWIISFYTLVAGVETPYTMVAGKLITFQVRAYVSFETSIQVDDFTPNIVGNDPRAMSTGTFMKESILIISDNIIPDLAKTPIAGSVAMYVLGSLQDDLKPLPDYTIAGKTITWNALNGGFSIKSGWRVMVFYRTNE